MFQAQNLSVLAYANNFTLWHYTTTDKLASVIEANYFDPAVDMLRVNDLIIANANTTFEPQTKFLIVTGNNGTNVNVALYF